MKVNDFSRDLAFSASHVDDDEEILVKLYPKGFIPVKTQLELDKRGADYFLFKCTPEGDAIALVDVKRRRAGCRKYWKFDEPEVVIELGDNGWLFKQQGSLADTIVFAFDAEDSDTDFAVSYSDLRRAALEHRGNWGNRFGVKQQHNTYSGSSYTSTAIFVPVSALEAAEVHVTKIPKGDIKNEGF